MLDEVGTIRKGHGARAMPSDIAHAADGGMMISLGAQVDRLRALAHAVGLDVEGDLLAVDERAQA